MMGTRRCCALSSARRVPTLSERGVGECDCWIAAVVLCIVLSMSMMYV